jgi:acetyl-CoA carboxylase biotin carboxyl carrier protein
MDLSEDDVREILKIFEQSKFDYLHLEQGALKVTVSKGGFMPAAPAAAAPAVRPAAAPSAQAAPPPAASAAAEPAAAATAVAADPGLITVNAPMVGTFYASPSPQDPPYAQVGQRIEVGATLGLIEVMKVFTSIKAETAGVIEKILIGNSQTVEFGQPLFLIRP